MRDASRDVLLDGFFFGLNALLGSIAISKMSSVPDAITARPRAQLLARALAGARVGVRALAADRQALAVTEAAVAAEVHQALDVHAATSRRRSPSTL